MTKDDLLNMPHRPEYIPGIHNYCDRWCERCAFTTRCMSFAMEKQFFPDPKRHDVSSREFWESIQAALTPAIELLSDWAKEKGIDINDSAGNVERPEVDASAEFGRLTEGGKDYTAMVDAWFDHHGPRFTQDSQIDSDILTKELMDAVSVIRWYRLQITVKILRALSSRILEKVGDGADDTRGKDSDGSAKVALIGIDNSIVAWTNLLRRAHDEDDRILVLLIHLLTLRSEVESVFPAARKFVRPGFDQEM